MRGTAQDRFLLRECLIGVDCAYGNNIEAQTMRWTSDVLVRRCIMASVTHAAPNAEGFMYSEHIP